MGIFLVPDYVYSQHPRIFCVKSAAISRVEYRVSRELERSERPNTHLCEVAQVRFHTYPLCVNPFSGYLTQQMKYYQPAKLERLSLEVRWAGVPDVWSLPFYNS